MGNRPGSPAQGSHSISTARRATHPGVGDTERILVVDDEPNITDLVATALRYEGFEVAVAGNGSEAIREAATFRPDLIVLDVMLPDRNGFELLSRLRADHVHLPVVFLTARDSTEDKIKGLTVGGDDYVTKPFSLEELLARVRAVLRRAHTQDRRQRSHLVRAISSSTTTATRCGAAARRSTSRRPSTSCCAT